MSKLKPACLDAYIGSQVLVRSPTRANFRPAILVWVNPRECVAGVQMRLVDPARSLFSDKTKTVSTADIFIEPEPVSTSIPETEF